MSGVMSGEVDAAEKARECWAWRAGRKWTNQGARDFAGGLVSRVGEEDTTVPSLHG